MKISGFRAHYLLVAIVAFAGFWLLRLGTGAVLPPGFQILALLAGLALFVGAAAVLFRDYRADPDDVPVRDPAVAHFLFASARSAPLWLGARIYLGYAWLEAGWEKVTDPAWLSGAPLQGYWERAVTIPEQGRPPISYDWYREYVRFMLDRGWHAWFADLVAWGELLVGLALIVGALVGVAAFFGALMNVSFMLAGTASTNPVLFGLSIALILAWRVAGLIGLDRWLLPALGAPWSPGRLGRGFGRMGEARPAGQVRAG